jgi:hypothetical protein
LGERNPRNAKPAGPAGCAEIWLLLNAERKQEGQHQGPITAAYRHVLHALLWHFLSYKDGLCFPPYETIARCCRDTLYEAIKALEASSYGLTASAARPSASKTYSSPDLRRLLGGDDFSVACGMLPPRSSPRSATACSYMVLKAFQKCFETWAWHLGGLFP